MLLRQNADITACLHRLFKGVGEEEGWQLTFNNGGKHRFTSADYWAGAIHNANGGVWLYERADTTGVPLLARQRGKLRAASIFTKVIAESADRSAVIDPDTVDLAVLSRTIQPTLIKFLVERVEQRDRMKRSQETHARIASLLGTGPALVTILRGESGRITVGIDGAESVDLTFSLSGIPADEAEILIRYFTPFIKTTKAITPLT